MWRPASANLLAGSWPCRNTESYFQCLCYARFLLLDLEAHQGQRVSSCMSCLLTQIQFPVVWMANFQTRRSFINNQPHLQNRPHFVDHHPTMSVLYGRHCLTLGRPVDEQCNWRPCRISNIVQSHIFYHSGCEFDVSTSYRNILKRIIPSCQSLG